VKLKVVGVLAVTVTTVAVVVVVVVVPVGLEVVVTVGNDAATVTVGEAALTLDRPPPTRARKATGPGADKVHVNAYAEPGPTWPVSTTWKLASVPSCSRDITWPVLSGETAPVKVTVSPTSGLVELA
jgi:hypothetical protein